MTVHNNIKNAWGEQFDYTHLWFAPNQAFLTLNCTIDYDY